MITKVYELVDATSYEIYYALGLYLSLEEAMVAAEKSPECWSNDAEDFAKVDIRERAIGWGDDADVVCSVEWNRLYDEDKEEYVWRKYDGSGSGKFKKALSPMVMVAGGDV